MPARIALKPEATADRHASDFEPHLAAAVDLVDAAAQLLGMIPPAANPIVISRQHLAQLQAASDAFVDVAEDVLEVRVDEPDVTAAQRLGVEAPVDGTPAELILPPVDRSAGGALGRAGYQPGDLDTALYEQATNPAQQAKRP